MRTAADEKTEDKPKKDNIVVIPVSGSEKSDSENLSVKKTETTENLNSETTDCLEQLQRLQAEFVNYRKRTEKEKDHLYALAKGDIILKLLPVLDDFGRMIEHHDAHDQIQCEGVQLIINKMKKILIDEGLEEIESVGKPFDPEIHEAVGIEKTKKDQENLIMEEWQKGYRYRDKLLRPSHVKVGKYDKEIAEEE